MRVALITDTHFGARNDSPVLHDHMERFYSNIFFPFLRENPDISLVIGLGDMFDRRKYTNHLSLSRCFGYFFDPLVRMDLQLYCLVGNHDAFYKNTLVPNTLELFLQERYPENVTIFAEPDCIDIDGTKVLMVPWICDANREETMGLMEKSGSTVCLGHLELKGFEMYRGVPQDGGIDTGPFQDFGLVCSGHYHHKSTHGVINYLGCPYEMTWADHDDPKGFHVLDTKTLKLEFIHNTHTLHEKLEYHGYESFVPPDTTGKFVKLDVHVRDSHLDGIIRDMEKTAVSVKVREITASTESSSTIHSLSDAEDTVSLIRRYIDDMADVDPEDRSEIFSIVRSVYDDAISLLV
jgi:Straboviridae/Ackermannviridae/Kyanoviridae exonuclease subunit 1